MLAGERDDRVPERAHTLGPAPENVDQGACMANSEDLRVRVGKLLGALQYRTGDLRRMVQISQMPKCPTQVAQCGCANILAILVLQLGVKLRVKKSSGLIEVR